MPAKAALKMMLADRLPDRFRGSLRRVYWQLQAKWPVLVRIGESQSDECDKLDAILRHAPVPQSFCEFGFHIREFNCARLVARGWSGLLIDADEVTVNVARAVLRRSSFAGVAAEHAFLSLENLRGVITQHLGSKPIGIVSIDVDGNDYWFLKEVLHLQPCVIVVEYNASLGKRPITVLYDAHFIRHQKHPSGWYHGASITALSSLCGAHGYSLVDVSSGGQNLFFVRQDLLEGARQALDPVAVYRESSLRNLWSKTTADEQWLTIQHLPFVTV